MTFKRESNDIWHLLRRAGTRRWMAYFKICTMGPQWPLIWLSIFIVQFQRKWHHHALKEEDGHSAQPCHHPAKDQSIIDAHALCSMHRFHLLLFSIHTLLPHPPNLRASGVDPVQHMSILLNTTPPTFKYKNWGYCNFQVLIHDSSVRN